MTFGWCAWHDYGRRSIGSMAIHLLRVSLDWQINGSARWVDLALGVLGLHLRVGVDWSPSE